MMLPPKEKSPGLGQDAGPPRPFLSRTIAFYRKKGHTCCNERLYLQYNTLPPVQLFNYQVLNLVHKVVYILLCVQDSRPGKWGEYTLLIYCLLYSITILHLLALFMDMKPDTTNCVYRMVIPDLDNEYWDIKVANCGIVYPVTLPIALHPNPIGKN